MFSIDSSVVQMFLVIIGQAVAIIEILRRFQKTRNEELKASIEFSLTTRIVGLQNEYSKILTQHSDKILELEKEHNRDITTIKSALSGFVGVSVCNARLQYEDKMLALLEKGIEKLGEKIDSLIKTYSERG